MLLNSRMASIPCSPRHSISNMKDLQSSFQKPIISFLSPPTTPSLQYFNMRVTERLHRYRSLKRQWYEVATSIQNDPISPPKSESPLSIPDVLQLTHEQTIETKINRIKDSINSTTTTPLIKENNEKNSNELDPLHFRIQQDLIKLRKLIKARQKRLAESISSKPNINHRLLGETTLTNTAYEDQDNNNNNSTTTNIRKSSSLNRLKPLDQVKICGSQMHPSTFSQSTSPDRGIGITSNSSSTCSQYSKQQQQQIKQQNTNKTFNIHRSRANLSLPSDTSIHNSSSFKKKSTTPPKTNLKSSQSYRLPMPPILKKKQLSFIKQPSSIDQPLHSEPTTTCIYTYAASTSSATPHSMKRNRNKSLLPILLTSSSCIGVQQNKIPSENYEDNTNNDPNLRDYKQLINHLPKPIVSVLPQYDQDDYRILCEQLDHIRETMPDSNVYDNYTRIY